MSNSRGSTKAILRACSISAIPALALELKISGQNSLVKSSRLYESVYILSDVYINYFLYGLQ